jgi:hypothetical protein
MDACAVFSGRFHILKAAHDVESPLAKHPM